MTARVDRSPEGPDPFTDDELTAQALAAEFDPAVDRDAVSLFDLAAPGTAGLLPQWYMPSPMAGVPLLRGWRRRVGLLIILSLVLISAYGLCSTYGPVAFG